MQCYNAGLCSDDFKNTTTLVIPEKVADILKRKGEQRRKSDIATQTWKCFILQKHSTKNPMATKPYRNICILRHFQCKMKPKTINN